MVTCCPAGRPLARHLDGLHRIEPRLETRCRASRRPALDGGRHVRPGAAAGRGQHLIVDSSRLTASRACSSTTRPSACGCSATARRGREATRRSARTGWRARRRRQACRSARRAGGRRRAGLPVFDHDPDRGSASRSAARACRRPRLDARRDAVADDDHEADELGAADDDDAVAAASALTRSCSLACGLARRAAGRSRGDVLGARKLVRRARRRRRRRFARGRAWSPQAYLIYGAPRVVDVSLDSRRT